jgi:hypothetical protein
MNDIPAFPLTSDFVNPKSAGMTLRDYFAAKAMQAYCSDPDYRQDCDQEDTAIAAYAMADEMLKAREA